MGLSICQEKARESFSKWLEGDEQCFVLTGGPGRGKSFLTKQLLGDVRSILGNIDIYSTATTNKAAKIVAEFTGDLDSGTIHSLLGLRVRNNPKTGRTDLIRSSDSKIIRDAFILIDEISMIDDPMINAMDESTVNCRFLLVGDKDQLAPIKQNKPPIFHKGYTQCELDTVMRQDKGSTIVNLAEQLKNTINTGRFLPIISDDKDVIKVSGEEFQMLVNDRFAEDVAPDRFKVICWKNDTVRAYNDYIRGRHITEKHFVVGETVVTNNPIMQAGTTYYSTDEFAVIREATAGIEKDVAGYWYRLDRGVRVFQATDQFEVKSCLQQLAQTAKSGGSWHQYFLAKEFFTDLRPVHSCTSHKSQGSSYHAVFIDLSDIGECREWQQVARMLYVAVTRAKHKVYLYGELPHKYNNFSHKVT